MIADVNDQSADDLIDGVSSSKFKIDPKSFVDNYFQTDQELTYDYSHYFGTRRHEDDTHKHRDFAEECCGSEGRGNL